MPGGAWTLALQPVFLLSLALLPARPILFKEKGTPEEYKAGLELAIARGWLVLHESGTFVQFTQAGAELFATSA